MKLRSIVLSVIAALLAGTLDASAASRAEAVFVLRRPVALSAVVSAIAGTGARPISFEHIDGEWRGGFASRTLPLPDAVTFYRDAYARRHAGEPMVFAFRLDRPVATRGLGEVAGLVARRASVGPDDVVVVLADGEIALNPRAVSSDGETTPANVLPGAKPWAPERGFTTTYNDTGLCFPGIISCAEARGADHYLSFDRVTPGDEFEPDWAYEHDFKLYNENNWDSSFCPPNQRNDFWADSSAGIQWDTTMPDAYLDTGASDSCRYHDLTIGTYNPDKFVTRTYDINLVIAPGDHGDSEFQLRAEALDKDCEFSPWCVGIGGNGDGILLVGVERGLAPGCRTWVNGGSSATC